MIDKPKKPRAATKQRPTVRPRGIRMDFSPRPVNGGSSHPTKEKTDKTTDAEKQRHELARREVQRREEIHRQIEAQKEEEMILRRRAVAARKDLARRLEMERKNTEAIITSGSGANRVTAEEIERKRALIEERALLERRRIMAERRAKQARIELAKRHREELRARAEQRAAIASMPTSPSPEEFADESPRPVAKEEHKIRHDLGSIEDFEADLRNLEESSEIIDTREDDEDARSFTEESNNDDNFFEKVKESPRRRRSREDTSENNDNFVIGGYSPFINTEVEKRPLSGGERSFESTAAATTITNRPRGRYVPYEEPIPHKNIYARSVAKEKNNKKEVPTMVVGDTPKSSKVSIVVAIVLTIILGATIGAIAYLAIFQ